MSDATTSGRDARRSLPIVQLAAAFVGLFAAGVLALAHLLDLPVPCGESADCITVAAHPSSRVLGVPIALIGATAYVVAVGLILRAPSSRWARPALVVHAGVGTLVGAALSVYAHMVIGATCPWCVASAVAMTVLFVASLKGRRYAPASLRVHPAIVWGLIYATGIGLGVEAGLMNRAANAPPIPAERLSAVAADEFDDPLKSMGSPNALVRVVMFSDFWCPACRDAHASMRKFREESGGGVRVIIRHRPLRMLPGHESSEAAAVLSEIAAEGGRFEEFVDAVYAEPQQLDREGYLDLMERLGFDMAAIEERLADAADPALARVRADELLAWRLGIVDTPTFIVLAGDDAPVSANSRTLPGVLHSPAVQAFIAWKGEPGGGSDEPARK